VFDPEPQPLLQSFPDSVRKQSNTPPFLSCFKCHGPCKYSAVVQFYNPQARNFKASSLVKFCNMSICITWHFKI
jgi:hypothetical protein